jgi:hypothetical protein
VPGLPAGVGPVLWRAMAKVPEQRFATMIEFSRALSAAALPAWTAIPSGGVPSGNSTLRLTSEPSVLETARHDCPSGSEPPVAARRSRPASSPASGAVQKHFYRPGLNPERPTIPD